jgi:hypothetical protein
VGLSQAAPRPAKFNDVTGYSTLDRQLEHPICTLTRSRCGTQSARSSFKMNQSRRVLFPPPLLFIRCRKFFICQSPVGVLLSPSILNFLPSTSTRPVALVTMDRIRATGAPKERRLAPRKNIFCTDHIYYFTSSRSTKYKSARYQIHPFYRL